ncbi:MAG: hypothetical protein HQL20_00415 [Candidatus Omnitrophica bacterium]|nr:hypothetical protein [Candidatus Omnitrophota bacterium]
MLKQWSSYFCLAMIGGACVLYALFGSSFAEMHTQFAFLDFPVFIGEWLMIVCWCVLIGQILMEPVRWSSWRILILCYLFWVMVKMAEGYIQYGPYALRNAALFYYPVLSIMVVHFLRRVRFGDGLRVVFLVTLLYMISCLPVQASAQYACLMGGFFVAAALSRCWLRNIFFILLIFLFFMRIVLLSTGRGCFTGALVGVLFLAWYSVQVLRLSVWKQLCGIVVLSVFLGISLWMWGDRNALLSLITPWRITENYHLYVSQIEKKRMGFVPRQLKAKTYHENLSRVDLAKIDSVKTLSQTPVIVHDVITPQAVDPELAVKGPVAGQSSSAVAVVAPEVIASQAVNQKSAVKGQVAGKSSLAVAVVAPEVMASQAVNQKSAVKGQVAGKSSLAVAVVAPEVMASQAVKQKPSVKSRGVVRPSSSVIAPAVMAKQVVNTEFSVDNEMSGQFAQSAINNFRDLDAAYGNGVFRLLIWKDMLHELLKYRPLFGFSFGWPQRSPSLEILRMGEVDWLRDGWITPHNVSLHLIYRGGIVGLAMIAMVLFFIARMTHDFIRARSWRGGVLVSALISWIIIAQFGVILELPYNAIPFWTLFGVVVAYRNRLLEGALGEEG